MEDPLALKSNENKPAGNCYCGKDRNLNIIELLCAACNSWFHESCINYQFGKTLAFSMNYVFFCKNCSSTGLESFRRIQATLTQMCVTTIANLQHAAKKEGKPKLLFSKDKEIVPFIEQYWESMTTMPRRITQSWYATVQKTLLKDVNVVFSYEENSEDGQMYGLVNVDLTHIKPNYDAQTVKDGLAASQNLSKVGRQPKRKFAGGDFPPGKKGRLGGDSNVIVKLPAHGYPLEHPFNKDGYRYILAEPDPHAPFRQEFDESADWAGKPIPGWLYRVLAPSAVLLALHDRAPQLKISEDRLQLTGDKGYCMTRATHYVSRGTWYYEVTIEDMPEGSATRIGWGQEYANLQAPLGYDKFGYSWRSRKGTKFHESHGKHFAAEGYGEGDTLGFLIVLPDPDVGKHIPNTYKDRPLVKFKSHLYYEDKDKVNEALKSLKTLPGSKILFFKNGKCEGVAFQDIYAGCYYPAIAPFKGVTVSANFGPKFKYPQVLKEYQAKGMHERAEEFICEQAMADIMYFTENDGKLRLDTFCA
ncbi:set1/Ash2 histone methyltransferase complex subunit ASH2 [Culicoides brevitarsis]|uniref:set1/Ash2 histone methyltransferase complex subunit ASH2 n=1 Tax=Culicoides brevitarsis TaxID=469753 RepID=UPI00307C2E80